MRHSGSGGGGTGNVVGLFPLIIRHAGGVCWFAAPRKTVAGDGSTMRLGIFSDIHANYEALSAVLEAYKTERIDVYYCLGDTVGYGGSPNECADIVREIARKTRSSATTTPPSPGAWTTRTTTRPRATRSTRTRRCSRPRTWRGCKQPALPGEARGHRRATSATARPCASRSSSTSSRPSRRASACRIWDKLGHITLIGHSHLCKVFALTPTAASRSCRPSTSTLEADKKYIVSVGSVGQPRDFDNRASYTVYDSDKKRFEFKRIEYDIELAADKVLRARLERNFAHRLFIGV